MKPWLASIIGVGAAALVVGGGLVLGAPDAAADGPSRPRTLGALPQTGDAAAELPLGDGMELAGRPSRLGIFWTDDSPDQVAQTYADTWKAAGLFTTIMKLDKVTSVSGLDIRAGADSNLQRSVTIIDEGNDRLVMPGLTDLTKLPDTTPRTAPVPVPETAFAYSGETTDDGDAISFSAQFQVPLTPKRVMDFYEQELGKDHYAVRAAPKRLRVKGMSLEMARGPEWISIIAADDDTEKKVATTKLHVAESSPWSQVMITHVRTIAPKAEWKP